MKSRERLFPFTWLGQGHSLAKRLFSSQIGQEMLGSMGLKMASVGLVFVSSVLLARGLGPTEYGVYSYVYALVMLVTVPAEFGLPTLVVRETARGIASGNYALVKGIWRWSNQIIAILSVILAGGTFLFISLSRNMFAGERLITLLWGLVLVPLIALGDVRGAALRGLQRVVAGQLPEFLLRPGLFVLLLGAVMLSRLVALSAAVAMALYVLSAALAFLTGIWLLWRVTPLSVREATPRFESRAWLMSAWSLAWIGGMQIINQQVAILLQGFFLPDDQIGIFRVATQVSQVASVGLLAVNMVVAPRFASLYAQREMKKLQNLVTKSTQAILVFNLLVTIGLVLGGKSFLRIVFGLSYQDAYFPLLILLTGQLFNSGVGSVGNLLNMTGHEMDSARAMGISALFNVALNLLLLPKWQVLGSSLATTLSLTFWNVLLWWVVWKKLKINSLAFVVNNQAGEKR
jgi:O-antigen/teichoic acid export membrane protein